MPDPTTPVETPVTAGASHIHEGPEVNVTPLMAGVGGGFSGFWGQFAGLGIVAFFMGACFLILWWQHDAGLLLQKELADSRKVYHDDIKAERDDNRKDMEKLWTSVNTANHNAAGITNGMGELLKAINSLQADVKALNRTAARTVPDSNVRAAVEPDPFSNGDDF